MLWPLIGSSGLPDTLRGVRARLHFAGLPHVQFLGPQRVDITTGSLVARCGVWSHVSPPCWAANPRNMVA